MHLYTFIALLAVLASKASATNPPRTEASCFASYVTQLFPGNTFPLEPGPNTMSFSSVQGCASQYPNCFAANGLSGVTPGFSIPAPESTVCREVLRYTVPVMPTDAPTMAPPGGVGVSEEQCPITSVGGANQCDCRFVVPTTVANITFRASLTTESCCQRCTCVGDPHCTSFEGAYDNWVTCNAREADTCEVNPDICRTRTWLDVPCRARRDTQDNGACTPDTNYPNFPTMKLYSKNYIHPTNNQQYSMDLTLRLGSLGNIVCIFARYGPVANPSLRSLRMCTPDFGGGYDINRGTRNGARVGEGLSAELLRETEVSMYVIMKNPGGLAERLELWIDDRDQDILSADGFCETGNIEEKLASDQRTCTPSEEFMYKRLCQNGLLRGGDSGCARRARNVGIRKTALRQWCTSNFPNNQLRIDTCINVDPWYVSVCKRLCNFDQACQSGCLERIREVPNEVVVDLKGPAGNPFGSTRAPTPLPTACPTPLAAWRGFARPAGPGVPSHLTTPFTSPDAYLFLQQLDRTSQTWGNPLLWWTKAHLKCGINISPMGTAYEPGSIQYPATMTPGETYRLLQCQRFTDRCGEKVLDFDASVTYFTPIQGAAGQSQHMRTMYDSAKLVCSRNLYRGCPPDFRCCVWENSQIMWNNCMLQSYGPNYAISYPTCTRTANSG